MQHFLFVRKHFFPPKRQSRGVDNNKQQQIQCQPAWCQWWRDGGQKWVNWWQKDKRRERGSSLKAAWSGYSLAGPSESNINYTIYFNQSPRQRLPRTRPERNEWVMCQGSLLEISQRYEANKRGKTDRKPHWWALKVTTYKVCKMYHEVRKFMSKCTWDGERNLKRSAWVGHSYAG